jgi:hypothetical protein
MGESAAVPPSLPGRKISHPTSPPGWRRAAQRWTCSPHGNAWRRSSRRLSVTTGLRSAGGSGTGCCASTTTCGSLPTSPSSGSWLGPAWTPPATRSRPPPHGRARQGRSGRWQTGPARASMWPGPPGRSGMLAHRVLAYRGGDGFPVVVLVHLAGHDETSRIGSAIASPRSRLFWLAIIPSRLTPRSPPTCTRAGKSNSRISSSKPIDAPPRPAIRSRMPRLSSAGRQSGRRAGARVCVWRRWGHRRCARPPCPPSGLQRRPRRGLA